MTDMARQSGPNNYCGGEDIEAISEDDAFGFLQAHSQDSGAAAAIDKYFGDRVEEA